MAWEIGTSSSADCVGSIVLSQSEGHSSNWMLATPMACRSAREHSTTLRLIRENGALGGFPILHAKFEERFVDGRQLAFVVNDAAAEWNPDHPQTSGDQ